MPRSSGQNAMPSRAIALEARVDVSFPLKRMEPVRLPTMPMTAFRLVVLPAPLRPSRVTTSPSATSKSMPCRMCDSPYQALRPRTSSMPGAQVGLYHLRVLRDAGVVAFGEDLAAREHGDAVGERRHHGKVVLDHQHRAVGRDALHQRGDALD